MEASHNDDKKYAAGGTKLESINIDCADAPVLIVNQSVTSRLSPGKTPDDSPSFANPKAKVLVAVLITTGR